MKMSYGFWSYNMDTVRAMVKKLLMDGILLENIQYESVLEYEPNPFFEKAENEWSGGFSDVPHRGNTKTKHQIWWFVTVCRKAKIRKYKGKGSEI